MANIPFKDAELNRGKSNICKISILTRPFKKIVQLICRSQSIKSLRTAIW